MTSSGLPLNIHRSPQGLFIYLWSRVSPSSSRAIAVKPPLDFLTRAKNALNLEGETEAFAALLILMPVDDSDQLEALGKLLWLMEEIDKAFYRIHPRAVVLSGTMASSSLLLPMWLNQLAETRIRTGVYYECELVRLIPRGPLRRASRNVGASSAEMLADRFAAATVVPVQVKLQERPIKLVHRVLGFDAVHGVPGGSPPLKERIGFVPIAEIAGDIAIMSKHRVSQSFLDYRLSPAVNAASRLLDALELMGALDVAIAPELVMREEHANELGELLALNTSAACRVIIAGSGQTQAQNLGQPWNETCIFNAAGSTLWRQRKLWPAGIQQKQATSYGVTDTGPTDQLLEDTAAGDTVEIVDIDSFGRCIVLICQDFTALSMASDLIHQMQPDWIFVPILDTGIDPGRWVHQNAFAHSGESSARFLVCSSTALAEQVGKPPTACGMVVGAMNKTDGEDGRHIYLCHAVSSSTPKHVVVQWDRVDWQISELSARSKIT